MFEKIRHFYGAYCAPGDRLGETFYAVWMVVVSIGLLNSGGQITPEHIAYVVSVALVVNLSWGVIDGITVMLGNIIDRVQRDRVVHDLKAGRNGSEAKALADLDDTVVAVLPEAERRRIVAAVAEGPSGADPRTTPYWPAREDWLYALGIVGIDVFVAVPVVAPIILIHDVPTAVYISRLIATAIFAALGAAYARNVNHRRWPAAIVLGALGFALFTSVYAAGW